MRFQKAKTAVFALLSVIVAGGFVFLFYQQTFAQFQAPCDTPPNCQPDAKGAGAGNLLEVLTNEAPNAAAYGKWTDPRTSVHPDAGKIGIGGGEYRAGELAGRVRLGIGTSTPGYPLDVIAQNDGDEQSVLRLGYAIAGKIWTGLRLDRKAGDEKWFVGMMGKDANNDHDNFIIKTKVNGQDKYLLNVSQTDAEKGSMCIGGTFAGFSASTPNGNVGGYEAANAMCAGLNSHVCTLEEMYRTLTCRPAVLKAADTGDEYDVAWINAGLITADAIPDCSGWTDGGNFSSGSYWEFNQTTVGSANTGSCSTDLKFACCR